MLLTLTFLKSFCAIGQAFLYKDKIATDQLNTKCFFPALINERKEGHVAFLNTLDPFCPILCLAYVVVIVHTSPQAISITF